MMNKLKYLILPLLLSFVFFSCDDNEPIDNPIIGGIIEPEIYPITVDVSLHSKYSVVNHGSGETIIDVEHGVADAQTFVCVVHDKKTGDYKSMNRVKKEDLQKAVVDGKFPFVRSLPVGEFYLSFVALMETDITSADAARAFSQPMMQKYEDAVVQIPNDYIYYNTIEIKVTSDKDLNSKKQQLELKKMTTDLVFEFTDAYKVPKEGKYSFTIGVIDVPSVFYLASGITLTDKEAKELGLNKYTAERQLQVPTTATKELVAQFHTLSNTNLIQKERGKYWFEFREDLEGSKPIKSDIRNIEEFECDASLYYLYITELYSPKTPKFVKK